jgi:hypothetical protein
MVNWTTKHQQDLKARKRERIDRLVKAPAWFLAGVILTLLFQNWFVHVLPGPRPTVTVKGSRSIHGDGQGCILYSINLQAFDPIDYTYLKIAFPGNIQDSQVGIPNEVVAPGGLGFRIDIEGAYRDLRGACAIRLIGVNKDAGILSSTTMNVFSIQTSKLHSMTAITALVALDEGRLATSEVPYFKGEYEYTKMGIPVRKQLEWKYLGITDAR